MVEEDPAYAETIVRGQHVSVDETTLAVVMPGSTGSESEARHHVMVAVTATSVTGSA